MPEPAPQHVPAPVEELLDRAIAALNRGDVAGAHDLADQVLATEAGNTDASDLLAAQVRPEGEIRRLTVMFSDLVGSTALSERLEPETYHSIVVRYQRLCRTIVEERYEGSIISFRGDGILATFGVPVPHENEVDRAVLAGLDLIAGVDALAADVEREHQEPLGVRVAVHKGVVFLDREAGDLYGFAVNVAARLESLAEPGTMVISDEVQRLVGDRFELHEHEPREVKGVAAPIVTYTVLGPALVHTARTHAAPLIGREAELAELRALWAQTAKGERPPGSCAAIVGESGIGKSRLASALCADVEDDGGVVVELIGSSFHTGVGLWPVRRLVEERCTFTRQADGPARLALLRTAVAELGLEPFTLPLLAALVGLDPSAGYEPAQSDARRLREEISRAALGFLGAAFGGRPGVLLCDDHQWFDDETRDLVGQLLRSDRSDVLVVHTARDASEVPRGSGTTTIRLEPLADGQRRELLAELGGRDLPADVVETVVRRSDGVPLYLEELLRAAIHAPSEPAPTGSSAGPGDAAVPEILYEPLVARLNVSANGASVAGACAIIGREVDVEVLARVAELPAKDLDEALTALLGGLILERAEPGAERMRFRHELLRAVAYDLQPPSRRRDLHGRVADALLEEAADVDAVDWALVARHYVTAGRAVDAANAFDRAADGARRRGALAEARVLLGEAIEVIAADAAAPEREVDLRLRRGFLAVSLEGNSSADAAADYERCLELSLDRPESDQMFSTLNSLWSYYAARGDLDRATELLDTLLRTQSHRRPAARFLSVAGKALVMGYRGHLREVLGLYEEAVALGALFDGEDDYRQWWHVPLDPAASSHTGLAGTRFVTGDLPGAFRQFTLGREAAAALPFPQNAFTLAGLLTFEVWLRGEIGDLDGATRAVEEIEEIAARHGFDQWSIVAATQREVLGGWRILHDGSGAHHADALSRHAHAIGMYLSMWKMVEQWVFVTFYATIQGAFHAAAGDLDLAIATLEDSLEISERTGMGFYDVETLRRLANLRADPAERVAGLARALDLAREQHTVLYEVRVAADLHDATGDLEPLRIAVGQLGADVTYPALDAARSLLSGP
jgi:class 3 adenylate cyclase/tetratricopeptide (TPR) repeat protein